MGERLKEKDVNFKPVTGMGDAGDDGPESMTQGQALALITKAFLTIASSLDVFALIAERWALREKLLSEKDLEDL